MRGRQPSGPEYVESLPGSEQAKQRLRVILETMTGAYGVAEACRRLDISEPRFYQLRAELLQAAIERLEPRPAGRPRQGAAEAASDVAALEARVNELETELRAAQLRQEIAVAMPHLVQEPAQPEKKNARAAETPSPAGLVEEAQEVAASGGNAENVMTPPVVLTDAQGKAPTASEAQHLERLQDSFAMRSLPAAARRRRRGRQQRQATLRRAIRRDVVDFYHWLHQRGSTLEQAAQRLCLTPRTLRQWHRRYQPEPARPSPLGRPAARSDQGIRQAVVDFIKHQGPGIGVPSLLAQFPDLARAELAELVQRYRRVLHERYPTCQRVVHWCVPGRAWAIDWAEPSERRRALPAIDGHYPYLLAVRDLASGYQLCWWPVPQTTSASAIEILAKLFAEHGQPLVMKSDNGPSFRSQDMKDFLERAGVFSLFSPPHWPGYNGAIEAAIGSLKTRTANAAARQGRAGCWSSADVEAARLQANTSRPRRLHGRTPTAVWTEHISVPSIERARFELAVQRHRYLARAELNMEQDEILDHWQNGRLDRKAIQRALVEHDYLLFKGRRLPLRIKRGKVTFFG
jgi:Integrase core domain/Helix-turn-helix domain